MVTRDAGGEAEADKAGVGKLASKRCGQIPVPRLRRGDGQHLGPQNKLCERYKGLVPLSLFSPLSLSQQPTTAQAATHRLHR